MREGHILATHAANSNRAKMQATTMPAMSAPGVLRFVSHTGTPHSSQAGEDESLRDGLVVKHLQNWDCYNTLIINILLSDYRSTLMQRPFWEYLT